MRNVQNALKNKIVKEKSQFELTNFTLNNLSQFKLTPTAKLVLLYLTTCYNPKHKEVFPKQKTIADKLGISEVSVTRAIQELHKEGLVFSERKISNIYRFSSKIVSERSINLIDDKQQIDSKENIKKIDSYVHEQIKETKKEQTVDDYKILENYAKSKGAKNIPAYINALKKNGSASQIIKSIKNNKKNAEKRYIETQKTIKLYESFKLDRVMPETCSAWVELGKKLGYKRIP